MFQNSNLEILFIKDAKTTQTCFGGAKNNVSKLEFRKI
jgi:hypothetical protein